MIWTDNAAEFVALRPWGESKGIVFEFIETDTQPQNGVAEHYNRIVMETTRALLTYLTRELVRNTENMQLSPPITLVFTE